MFRLKLLKIRSISQKNIKSIGQKKVLSEKKNNKFTDKVSKTTNNRNKRKHQKQRLCKLSKKKQSYDVATSPSNHMQTNNELTIFFKTE